MACTRLFFERLSRRKYISTSKLEQSNLHRCLNVFDLTALGVGSTLGLGIYVLAGKVAKDEAGPAVVLSFLIAAIASVFAGLCYAEFSSRVPRAGSAYIYSYVTVGEFIAFIIGWNLILEYVIGTASVARGYSGYFDSLIGHTMTNKFRQVMPMHLPGLSPYPDIFAFGMTFLLAIVLSVGVKESSKVNNVLTCLNLVIVAYVVICGLFKARIYNWQIPKKEIPKEVDGGDGGFFPFGFSGMMAGAATCFYGFVGFDAVATTGEEARNPQRSIPISIIISLALIFLSYFGVSAVVTLMVPYYYQDPDAAIPMAFLRVGWPVGRWIISIGALAGLSTSLLGCMFPLPRVLYAMANDGLIFRFLSRISPRFKTPFLATIISGLFAALMAMMFELSALVDMMSIGTLLAYTLVAVSVMILRYHPITNENSINEDMADTVPDSVSSEIAKKGGGRKTFIVLRQLFNCDHHSHPTPLSGLIASWGTFFAVIFMASLNAMIIFAPNHIVAYEPWAISFVVIFAVLAVLAIAVIAYQPSSNRPVAFMVPWVPFVPAISCMINTHLMLKLSAATWVRFGVWMVIGFAIYFLYGMWQSSEEYNRKGLQPPTYIPEDAAPPVETGVAGAQTMAALPSPSPPCGDHETSTVMESSTDVANGERVVKSGVEHRSSSETAGSACGEPPSYTECLNDYKTGEMELAVIDTDSSPDGSFKQSLRV